MAPRAKKPRRSGIAWACRPERARASPPASRIAAKVRTSRIETGFIGRSTNRPDVTMAGVAPIPKGFRGSEKPVWGAPFMQKFGRIVYEVFGTLNAAGDNCVLLPTFYGGTSKANRALIGPGRVLDPTRW